MVEVSAVTGAAHAPVTATEVARRGRGGRSWKEGVRSSWDGSPSVFLVPRRVRSFLRRGRKRNAPPAARAGARPGARLIARYHPEFTVGLSPAVGPRFSPLTGESIPANSTGRTCPPFALAARKPVQGCGGWNLPANGFLLWYSARAPLLLFVVAVARFLWGTLPPAGWLKGIRPRGGPCQARRTGAVRFSSVIDGSSRATDQRTWSLK